MNRLFFVFASTPALADVCSRLCDAFRSADLRFDGQDLCEGATSICYHNITGGEYCSNLYYATAEDGSPGIFFESDPSTLTPEELSHPLSCQQAGEIIYVPGNTLEVALRIFGSSFSTSELPNLYENGTLQSLAHFLQTSNSMTHTSVFEVIGLLANATNRRSHFDSRLVRVIHCHDCNSDIYESYTGSIRAQYEGPEVAGLVDVLRTALETSTSANVGYQCSNCDYSGMGSMGPFSLNSTSDVLAITVRGTRNLEIPHELNVTQIVPSFTNQPGYRLFAIASANRPRIQIDRQWYLMGMNGDLLRTSPPGVVVTNNDTDFVFYKRIVS